MHILTSVLYNISRPLKHVSQSFPMQRMKEEMTVKLSPVVD